MTCLFPRSIAALGLLVAFSLSACSTILGIEDRELRPGLEGGGGEGGGDPMSDVGVGTKEDGSNAGGTASIGGGRTTGPSPMPSPDPNPVDPAMPPAYQCLSDGDCPADSWCIDGQCRPLECPYEAQDCNGYAGDGCETDVMYDPNNCGGCGNQCMGSCENGACVDDVCGAAFTYCAGQCVDLSSDPNHCGQCFSPCAGQCVDYACAAACPAPLEPCGTGCYDLEGDPSNCGSCGYACGPGRTCMGGICESSCGPGQVVCGGVCVRTDSTDNCGGCNLPCPAPPQGGSIWCDGMSCIVDCGSMTDCQGTCVDLVNDNQNCGSCGRVCAVNETCNQGNCEIAVCPSGYDDCDGISINGCETRLDTLTDCGSCNKSCAPANATARCDGGVCTIDACSSGYDDCDGLVGNGCETYLSSNVHCGACNVVCAPPEGGDAYCASGVCGVTCPPDYGDCGSGTCISLTTNDNCGACGQTCNLPNASSSCVGPMCQIDSCAAGWGDCNGLPEDGCEAPLDTLTNCGWCGVPCSAPDGQISCSTGTCRIVSCSAGSVDTNGIADDGCETACSATGTEVCDGADNDCDGFVDFGMSPCDVPNQPGLAYGWPSQCRQGLQSCAGACEGYIGPSVEVCDGVDNDCNGSVDDGVVGEGEQCGSDLGECVSGIQTCSGGALVCVGDTGPTAEVCDDLDNDCDGFYDEGLPAMGPCGTDLGECQPGTLSCVGGQIQCVGALGPTPEICGNNADEDCNGIAEPCP